MADLKSVLKLSCALLLFMFSASAVGVHIMDSRIPNRCSSPGWQVVPRDVSALLGTYVHFNCRSSIHHTSTVWLYNGQNAKTNTSLASKFVLYGRNTSVRYGPVSSMDNGAVIGCEVVTSYGNLPSSVGRISIQSAPQYNPILIQAAYVGQPYDFDFNYIAPTPPSSFRWFKNRREFKGDGDRVTLDHTGITFARVLPTDAGQYTVRASNGRAEMVEVTATLKLIFFRSGEHIQSGSSPNPISSTKLAVTVALSQSKTNSSSRTFHMQSNSNTYASSYATNIMRLFTQFKKATPSSKRHGNARLELERILKAIIKLLDYHGNNLNLSKEDMARIAAASNCTFQPTPNCTKKDFHFRSADGTCNNFFYPLNGAAGVSLARILPANYEDGISLPVGHTQIINGSYFEAPWPSARLVSWRVIRDLKVQNRERISHMFMQWGQFVDHDLDISPVFDEDLCQCNYTERCVPIEVKPEDTVFGTNSTNKGNCIPMSRSVPVCSSQTGNPLARNHVNDLTSYIDASNVYGSDKKHARSLRLLKGGLLKQGERLESLKGNLPFQEDSPKFTALPFFVAGDARANEQVGLTIMHTIWMREHNRIAHELKKINSCWNDERLYQETRKIVGAMQQVISFKEFLPVLFGSHFDTYISDYTGYNPFIDSTIPASFSGAAYRFGHSLVKGKLLRLNKDFRRLSIGALPLNRAFFNPISYFESNGTDPILRGLTVDKVNPTDEFLERVLTSQLFTESPNHLGSDLASLNIQRGRDHGLPTYRAWEKFCKKLYPGVRSYFQNGDTVRRLKEVYGSEGFRNGIDLWVGGLSERRLPGAQVGPTFACIIGLTFSRLRDGDRFWYENPYVFTSAQRFELKKQSLAKVVCTNADHIPKIQRSVFYAGGQRESCSAIPGVNLWRWWDRSCHYRRYFHRRG